MYRYHLAVQNYSYYFVILLIAEFIGILKTVFVVFKNNRTNN